MVKIYALVSGQLILYVGKTIMTLKKRETNHRCKKCNTTKSRYIPDYIDWEIKLLEEVTNDQGVIKEQYYFDTLKPLYNYQRPGGTNIQYKDSISRKETKKKYYLKKKSEKEISTTN